MFDIRIIYRVVYPQNFTDKFEKQDVFNVGENPIQALTEALKNRASDGEFHCALITKSAREE